MRLVVILELESIIYKFSLIFRAFLTSWKIFFSSSDMKTSSNMMFSSLSSGVILFVNFLFSEKRVGCFSKKLCYLWFWWHLIHQTIFWVSPFTLLQKSLRSLHYFKDLVFFFMKHGGADCYCIKNVQLRPDLAVAISF